MNIEKQISRDHQATARTVAPSSGTRPKGGIPLRADGNTNVYRYLVLFILTLIYVFNFVDRQIIAVLTEPIKADLQLSDVQMGFLTGLAFAIFYTSFGIPVAWLADRTNRVRVIAISCALWSLCSAACGFAGNFMQLALARIGVGVGEAGGSPPSYSVISDYFEPRRRATALAIFSLGVALGPAVGSALGGWAATSWGWRTAFLVVGLPGFVLAILAILFVREPQRGRLDSQPEKTSAAPETVLQLKRVILDFARNRTLMLTAFSSGISAFVGYSIGAWTPAMLMRTKGMSLAEIAVYYSVLSGVVSAVGTLGSGAFVDWAGHKNPRSYALVPAAAYAVALPFFLAALVAPDWTIALCVLIVPMTLTITFLAPALAVVQNSVPADRRSSAGALLLFVLNLVGLGGGPLYVGFVSDYASAYLGSNGLLVGLASLTPFFLLAVVLHYLTSRSLAADALASASQNTGQSEEQAI